MATNSEICRDVAAYVISLKRCVKKKDLCKGTDIHLDIAKKGLLRKSCYLGNALVCMYVKCDALSKAKEVLEELPFRDVVSWSTLMSGYNKKGQGEKVLACFERMVSEGLAPDAVTFACILKACGSTGSIGKGQQLHEEILRLGLLEKDAILGNALIDMYAKCGMLEKAKYVLNQLRVRDIISWNTLMAGFLQQGQGQNVIDCFKCIQNDGLSPDVITFATMLKACASVGAIKRGNQIHEEIVERGLFGKYNMLGNALVSMYAKFGMLTKAQQLFDELRVKDVISWNALIDGYAQLGQSELALKYFEQMRRDGFSPDAITFTSALNLCGNMRLIMMGKEIHDEVVLKGLLQEDPALATALMGMYAKCGELEKAQEVFNELRVRSIVSWSALITGYTHQGQCHEALNQFEQMRNEGFSPDVVSFICILKTCSSIGALHKGIQIHNEIFSKGLLEKHVELGNALVDMYVKCSQLDRARKVFDKLLVQDVFAWTTLISGYTREGQGEEAMKCFEVMIENGHSPNEVTFLCVLSACSHLGLVERGQMCFTNMSERFGISPDRQHYTCMVDLLGSAGLFEKAMAMIQKSLISHYPLWMALLGACRKSGNVRLARLAFEQAIYLDVTNSAAYVCMEKIFADAGLHEDAQSIGSIKAQNCVC